MPKFLVIAGVTQGRGRAMLGGFAAAGHILAGCGRSANSLAELAKKFPAPHAFEVVDVSDDIAVSAWAKTKRGDAPSNVRCQRR